MDIQELLFQKNTIVNPGHNFKGYGGFPILKESQGKYISKGVTFKGHGLIRIKIKDVAIVTRFFSSFNVKYNHSVSSNFQENTTRKKIKLNFLCMELLEKIVPDNKVMKFVVTYK